MTLPAAPVRCEGCNAVLADRVADCYVVRHRGRELIFRDLIAARCDRCGRAWPKEAAVHDTDS